MSRAYFISDIHLKDPEESNSQALLLFLHGLENGRFDGSHLFLVGDIFDLWISDHSYFLEKYHKIINAIKVLVAQGIEVHYFEGNHDLYLKKFWQQDVGVQVHDGPSFFNLFGHRVRVEHGDFMNPDDKAYLRLRAFLRTSGMKLVAEQLPGAFVSWLGDRMSRASRHYTSTRKALDADRIREFMHAYAHQVCEERAFDYLITGHTHLQDDYEFDHLGEKVHSLNLGSWFDGPKALCLDSSEHQFLNL